MAVQLEAILQIAIPAKDIDRATAFYRDTLEIPLLFTGPNMAFFNCGGVRLYVDANKIDGDFPAGANSFVYFRTADIERQHAELKERKVQIHRKPHLIAALADRDVWLMWIRDTEGNLLGLMEERRK